jgi:tetratricopeptide (TPR) repeat protein
MKGVAKTYEEKNAIRHNEQSWKNVSQGFINIAETQTLCGNLRDAVASTSEALFYAGVTEETIRRTFETSISESPMLDRKAVLPRPPTISSYDNQLHRFACCLLAQALSLSGQLAAASRNFAAADSNSQSNLSSPLQSGAGVYWSEHRLRLGEMEAAHVLTEKNRAICERLGWNDDLARCNLLLGRLEFLAQKFASAERCITEAICVFRDGHQGMDLPAALFAMAQIRRAVQLAPPIGAASWSKLFARIFTALKLSVAEPSSTFTSDESAFSHCEESLRLAARSGFLLKKCDALNFRALLLRESGQPEKAFTDAREAHDIATRCEYYWGLHEALRQLRDTAKALNRTAEFREWDKAERNLTEKMKPEIEEALRINREHDAEMEKLYGKKKK